MIYFDTNILIYTIMSQGEKEMDLSMKLIQDAKKKDKFLISTLSIQELIYSLTKLKAPLDVLEESFIAFLKYSKGHIDNELISGAFNLCKKLQNYKIFLDAIHLKFAERYCSKLITFDKDFNKFIPHTQLQIEILN
jgi:predicted nucleic acid-binding protein